MAWGAASLAMGLGAFSLVIDDGVSHEPDEARLAHGAALYKANCAACHGADLQGEPDWQRRNADGTMRAPPHTDRGHTWQHADAYIFAYIKEGGTKTNSVMPAFADTLSDDAIGAVMDYIKSTWPDQVRGFQAQMQ